MKFDIIQMPIESSSVEVAAPPAQKNVKRKVPQTSNRSAKSFQNKTAHNAASIKRVPATKVKKENSTKNEIISVGGRILIGAGIGYAVGNVPGAVIGGSAALLWGCTQSPAGLPIGTMPQIKPSSSPKPDSLPQNSAPVNADGSSPGDFFDGPASAAKGTLTKINALMAPDAEASFETVESNLANAKTSALTLLETYPLVIDRDRIKINALLAYLDALGRQSQSYKVSIDQIDKIYSDWISKSKTNKDSVTLTINGKDYTVTSLDPDEDAYIYGNADIAHIKNLIEKKDLATAESKCLEILNRADNDSNKSHQPGTKKLALVSYLDALTRESKKYRQSLESSFNVYTGKNNDGWKFNPSGTYFSVILKGKTYYGIANLDPKKDKYIFDIASIIGLKKHIEDADAALNKTKLDAAKSEAGTILGANNYPPYIKKQAFAAYLDAMSRTTQNNRDAINRADQFYSSWKSKGVGELFSVTIDGTTYNGIEALDPSSDAYLYSAADVIEINNLFEQGSSDETKWQSAKTKALAVLARANEDSSIKKRALKSYRDALDRQGTLASWNEAVRIDDAWLAASIAGGPDNTISITIDGTSYTGIEPLLFAPGQTPSAGRSVSSFHSKKYRRVR